MRPSAQRRLTAVGRVAPRAADAAQTVSRVAAPRRMASVIPMAAAIPMSGAPRTRSVRIASATASTVSSVRYVSVPEAGSGRESEPRSPASRRWAGEWSCRKDNPRAALRAAIMFEDSHPLLSPGRLHGLYHAALRSRGRHRHDHGEPAGQAERAQRHGHRGAGRRRRPGRARARYPRRAPHRCRDQGFRRGRGHRGDRRRRARRTVRRARARASA